MQVTRSVSHEIKSETEILNFILHYAFEHELPIAFWRLPNSNTRLLIVSEKYISLKKDSAIEELPQGFIFAPFDREKESLFLPGDFVFRFENSELTEVANLKESASRDWLHEKYKKHDAVPQYKASAPSSRTSTQENFLTLVDAAVAQISSEKIEKVVVSRTKSIPLPEKFDIVEAFEKLCAKYSNALISFVSIPGVGHWLGATPETLVTIEDKRIFKTVALAGTMPFTEGMNIKHVAWTQKEIEEQALVERYVISCFKKIRVREYDEHGPKTVVAGNLVHLRSDFSVDMNAINFPQLGSVMLQLLHPTSAVAGMPLEAGLAFLKQHEGYDREFYCGYLGPINFNNNINIFVNLRCMKLLDGQALLFAGAGITVDSVAQQELEETDLKFRTLLNVIF
jgi:isochorismate synthase